MARGNYGSTDVNPRGTLGDEKLARDKIDKNLEAIAAVTSKPKRKKRRRKRFSPTENLRKRQEEEKEKPVLGKRLTAIASGFGPGRGKIGRAISGGLSGAALGATIGEAVERRKRRVKDEKASVS